MTNDDDDDDDDVDFFMFVRFQIVEVRDIFDDEDDVYDDDGRDGGCIIIIDPAHSHSVKLVSHDDSYHDEADSPLGFDLDWEAETVVGAWPDDLVKLGEEEWQELETRSTHLALSPQQQQQNTTLWVSANPINRNNKNCTKSSPCLILTAFQLANALNANMSSLNSSCVNIVLLGYVFPYVVKDPLPISTCINIVGQKLNVSMPQFFTQVDLVFERDVTVWWSASDFHYNVTLMTTAPVTITPRITFSGCS